MTDKINTISCKAISYIEDYAGEIISCVFNANWTQLDKIKDKIYIIIKDVFTNVKPSNLVKFVSSSGLVFVIIFEDYVLKIACKDSYNNMMMASSIANTDYLTKYIRHSSNFLYVVEERVDPIVFDGQIKEKYKKINYNKIKFDVLRGLETFHVNNLIHGDCTLDNIGFRKSTNTFVLFDFNGTRIGNPEKDLSTLNNSFKYHKLN